jgi:hypothetical protein
MVNDLDTGVFVVLGFLAGLAALLFLMSALDPTNVRRPAPSHRAARPGGDRAKT